MQKYKETLIGMLETDSSELFGNYSLDHAKCITETFISSAQKTVVLLTGDFSNQLYSDERVRSAIVNAVNSGVNIRVISLSPDKDNALGDFRASVMTDGVSGVFDFRIGRLVPGAHIQHFMVVDGKRYRLEAEHQEPNPSTVHAEVCCNGRARSDDLGVFFNTVWQKLTHR